MHSIFVQLSGLAGLLILFKGLWAMSPIDHSVLTAGGAGLAIYLVLWAVQTASRRIVESQSLREQVDRQSSAAESTPEPAREPAAAA